MDSAQPMIEIPPPSERVARPAEDVLLTTARALSMVRLLELRLEADGRVRLFSNAYRGNERHSLRRSALDVYLRELSSRAQGPAGSGRQAYRSGEIRFVAGPAEDERLWDSFAGLKFNLLSIDARAASCSETAMNLLGPILRKGLLDNDGFTVLFHEESASAGSIDGQALRELVTRLGERFAIKSENTRVAGDVSVVSFG